jgi:ATP-dependent RNA helicase DHX29
VSSSYQSHRFNVTYVGPIEGSEPRTPRTPISRTPRTPQTPRTPAHFLVPPTPTTNSKKLSLDANAPTFVPSRLLPRSALNEDQSDAEQADFKARILASFNHSASASDSGHESPDSENSTVEYARLKIKYDDLTYDRHIGNKADVAEAQNLRQRLDTLRNSYFFDEKEAHALYRIERDKATALALQEHLRGTKPPTHTLITLPTKQRPANIQRPTPTPPTVVPDIFDEDDDMPSMGGLLEILEDMPTTEIGSQGTTINIRDMALPKHWSGRTPKTLLKEVVAKADRYAAVTYSLISGPSRAKRAAVSIRWEGRKMDEWLMEDIACYDEGQAEQYIATVALHALTYPPTDGFAVGSSASSGTQTFFRLLPAVFRDLWDELEARRKLRDDTINRNLWARLRSIIEPKLELGYKVGHLARSLHV